MRSRILIRRLLFVVVVFLALLSTTFVLSRVVPRDPARLIAGPRASPEAVARIRRQYGLDRPLLEQYRMYLTRLVRGDLGMSMSTRRPVLQDLKECFPATVELVLASMSIAVVGGIAIGVATGIYRGRLVDHLSRLLSVAGLSMPAFWLGMLMQFLLYYRLGWLPFGERLSTDFPPFPHPTGLFTVDAIIAGRLDAFVDALGHLIMPALILSLGNLAVIARLMRASILEVMIQDYIRVARAKGLPEWRVVSGHALKNALLPTVTMIGMLIGLSLGGAVLVEFVFNWPGIGRYAARSLTSADHNAVMATTLLIGAAYLLTSLFVDLLYVFLDPRIRE